jgi:hypothetical protein
MRHVNAYTIVRALFRRGRRASDLEMGCRRGGVRITISSSLSVTAVKRMNVSTGMATETRSVRAWVSLATNSGVVYVSCSMVRM